MSCRLGVPVTFPPLQVDANVEAQAKVLDVIGRNQVGGGCWAAGGAKKVAIFCC